MTTGGTPLVQGTERVESGVGQQGEEFRGQILVDLEARAAGGH
jgi:hypothetical protein